MWINAGIFQASHPDRTSSHADAGQDWRLTAMIFLVYLVQEHTNNITMVIIGQDSNIYRGIFL
jgi:hypothetical protein